MSVSLIRDGISIARDNPIVFTVYQDLINNVNHNYIPNLTKTTLQGERIETPEYIKQKKLKLDYEFYMTNQIMKPSLQFLNLVLSDAKELFEPYKIRAENERMGRTNILDFCKKVDS